MRIVRNILFAKLCIIFAMQASARNYYVDAIAGKDQNNGLSPVAAWKTLEKVSGFSFGPGDIISFKSGQRFAGVLTISASGKAGKPVIYTTYGGQQPAIIDGRGDSAAVYSYNKEYITIRNLAVTNFREGEIKMDDLFNGIYIVNENAGVLHHFHFDRLKVFNVNSTYIARDEGKTDQSRFHGGVQFYTKGNVKRGNFDDVLVTNSEFDNLSRTGFNFRSDWDDRAAYSQFGDSIGRGMTDNWTPNTRVVFRNNRFTNIAGNGLIVRVAVNALIEHNLFDSCGKIISGNAVFNFNTDGTIYQYNEAKHTIYNEGDTDARGIDADYRTKNTVIQYNYLHDNELGGVTATGGPGPGENPINFNIGTIIRYNIIENNTRQGAYISGRVEGLQVYNNVFYADETINNVVAIKLNRWTVYPNGAFFYNNIFYFKGSDISYDFTQATNVRFERNLYYGIKPPAEFPDTSALTGDPLLQAPGTGKNGYRLKPGSPAIRQGRMFATNAVQDYYGNFLKKNTPFNIGIDNKTGN